MGRQLYIGPTGLYFQLVSQVQKLILCTFLYVFLHNYVRGNYARNKCVAYCASTKFKIITYVVTPCVHDSIGIIPASAALPMSDPFDVPRAALAWAYDRL